MCFRPSAMMQDNANIVTGNCPTCGMPVAGEADVTSGTCPYCGNAIPAEPSSSNGAFDSSTNVRIL